MLRIEPAHPGTGLLRYARLRARRLRRSVLRRLYRDPDPDLRRTVLVAGAGRSGTTWVAEMLAGAAPSRIIFEPFNHELVAELSRDYELRYARPGEPDSDLHAFLDLVFTGRIRGAWVDRFTDSLRPRFRIVKTVRANLLLGWIAREYPAVPILFVIRHPCAVVLSRMEAGWDPDKDIRLLLAQPTLWTDLSAGLRGWITDLRTPEEKHAAVWGLANRVPLMQSECAGMRVFRYERLVEHPDVEIPGLFRAAGRIADPRFAGRARRASGTYTRWQDGTDPGRTHRRWKRILAPERIERIIAAARTAGPDEREWMDQE